MCQLLVKEAESGGQPGRARHSPVWFLLASKTAEWVSFVMVALLFLLPFHLTDTVDTLWSPPGILLHALFLGGAMLECLWVAGYDTFSFCEALHRTPLWLSRRDDPDYEYHALASKASVTVDAPPRKVTMDVASLLVLDCVFVIGSWLSGFAMYWTVLLVAAIPWTAIIFALDPLISVERLVLRSSTVCITTRAGKVYVMPCCDNVKIRRSKRFGVDTYVSFRYRGRYWSLTFPFGSWIDIDEGQGHANVSPDQ